MIGSPLAIRACTELTGGRTPAVTTQPTNRAESVAQEGRGWPKRASHGPHERHEGGCRLSVHEAVRAGLVALDGGLSKGMPGCAVRT